jgi:hypothetical protein
LHFHFIQVIHFEFQFTLDLFSAECVFVFFTNLKIDLHVFTSIVQISVPSSNSFNTTKYQDAVLPGQNRLGGVAMPHFPPKSKHSSFAALQELGFGDVVQVGEIRLQVRVALTSDL